MLEPLSIRIAIVAILAVTAAGCSWGSNGTDKLVDSCTKRLLAQSTRTVPRALVRRYVQTAYCKPFAKRGWLHENGTFSIDAYRSATRSRVCAAGGAGDPARRVPCDQVDSAGLLVLDCAFLRLVSRDEVVPYLTRLQQKREIRCDDDTPLSQLGVATTSKTALTISGAIHASSRRIVGREGGCGYRPNRTIIYGGDPMLVGSGPGVARVEFFIRRFHGLPGPYDATGPAPYGRTTVQVVTGRGAAAGIATAFYVATSGKITILEAGNLGLKGRQGYLRGTVHAALHDGARRVRVDGTWRCNIEATANEGPLGRG